MSTAGPAGLNAEASASYSHFSAEEHAKLRQPAVKKLISRKEVLNS